MKIDKNKVVSLTYELHTYGNSGEKIHIETADDSKPLLFIFGIGSMIPGFEANLLGKEKDASFDFRIAPAEAYGELSEEAIVDLPVNIFMVDGVFDKARFTVGMQVPLTNNEGQQFVGTILNITDEAITMDFNHPMAGKELHFTGKVKFVREATPDELDHGHPHGPGGIIHP